MRILLHSMSARAFTICALVLMFGLATVLYVPDRLFALPNGVHYIRQTDSLAFVEYFKLGKGTLVQPGTLDLNTAPDNGRTAGEFPITYWIISLFSKWSLAGSTSLRALHLLIMLLGHVAFISAARKILASDLLALGLGAWLMGSSIVVYYGCNYLPDAASYGLVLIGWAGMLSGVVNGGRFKLWQSIIAFALAGAIKAPVTMHLIAACALLGHAAVYRKVDGRPRIKGLIGCLSAIGLVAAWHLWVIHYNSTHHAAYFLTAGAPIWKTSVAQRDLTVDLVLNYWWPRYLHPTTWHVLLAFTVVVTWRARYLNKVLIRSLALVGLGCSAFVLLFFNKLADHDYYFLTIMPFIALLMLAGLFALWQWLTVPWSRAMVAAGVWSLAIAGLILARTDLYRRSGAGEDRYDRTGRAMDTFMVGSPSDLLPFGSRVIVLGDSTPNGALSALGRQGWSFPGYPILREPDHRALVEQGATHVLTIDVDTVGPIPVRLLRKRGACALWIIER